MAGKILGPTGSRRRRRLFVVTLVAGAAALVFALGSPALNTELGKFEIDGNQVATTAEDWLAGTAVGTITSISATNPTTVTVAAHGLATGDQVTITGSNSTPSIDGAWTVTVTGANTFTIPVAVTVAGTTGTVTHGSAALKCTATPCTATNYGLVTTVGDGPGAGHGELFRDWLKVGDSTTTPTFSDDQTTFTQGDKENDFTNTSCPTGTPTPPCVSDTPWHIVHGSTPPNKDDLFDVAVNTIVSGTSSELDIGMVRTNNNGSSHLDFELNKQDWLPTSQGGTDGVNCLASPDPTVISGFKCPKRTEGDLLISFEINPDGSATERFFVWDLPGGIDAGIGKRGSAGSTVNCDGALDPFKDHPCPWEEISPPTSSGGVATVLTGVNSSPIPAPPWGFKNPDGTTNSTIPVGGWFEAGINLSALGFPPSCPGFGVASAKARSSGDSVTSALTDLAGPFPVNLNTCGKITIIKDTVPNALQNFHYTTAVTTPGAALSPSTFDLDDDSGVTGGDNTLSTTQVYNQVTPGSYTVTEGTVTGYVLTSLTCSTTGSGTTAQQHVAGSYRADITIGSLGEATCTYVNTLQQGAIKIIKTDGKGGRLQGATFAIKKGVTAITNSPFTTDANGEICVDHLSFGTDYTIQETGAPSGYKIDDPDVSLPFAVDNNATCADATYVGEGPFTYTDTPLSTIQVKVTSLAQSGTGTHSSIVCSSGAANTENGQQDAAFSITSNNVANPTVVTLAAATPLSNVNPGDKLRVAVAGVAGSVPTINGTWTATVVDSTHVTLPVNVTTGGSGGSMVVYDDTDETFGNGSTGLIPGTYTCTVVIDP
jgi:hypothetical protein